MCPPPGRILVPGTILFATICSLLTGCSKAGPALVDVCGQVTLDGLPLTEGTISFISSDGKIASARIDAGGGFRLACQYGSGVPTGDYHVAILPPPTSAARDPERMSGQGKAVSSPSLIPDRYQRPELSGLNAIVENGPLRLTFELTTP